MVVADHALSLSLSTNKHRPISSEIDFHINLVDFFFKKIDSLKTQVVQLFRGEGSTGTHLNHLFYPDACRLVFELAMILEL